MCFTCSHFGGKRKLCPPKGCWPSSRWALFFSSLSTKQRLNNFTLFQSVSCPCGATGVCKLVSQSIFHSADWTYIHSLTDWQEGWVYYVGEIIGENLAGRPLPCAKIHWRHATRISSSVWRARNQFRKTSSFLAPSLILSHSLSGVQGMLGWSNFMYVYVFSSCFLNCFKDGRVVEDTCTRDADSKSTSRKFPHFPMEFYVSSEFYIL